MAIKVKRKQTTREAAKQPDQIYTFTERVFNYLEQNRKVVLGSLAVILVVVVIVTFAARRVTDASREAGSAVTEVALLLDSPVGESPSEQVEVVFDTLDERAQAIRDALSGVSGAVASPAAQMLDGLSSMTLGDITRAQSAFESASRAENAPLMALVALQGLAATQAETGDIELAEATLARFAELNPVLEDFAKMETARLNEAVGRLNEALAHYSELANRRNMDPGSEGLVGAIQAITDAASHRALVLSVYLGESDEEVIELPIELPDESNE